MKTVPSFTIRVGLKGYADLVVDADTPADAIRLMRAGKYDYVTSDDEFDLREVLHVKTEDGETVVPHPEWA